MKRLVSNLITKWHNVKTETKIYIYIIVISGILWAWYRSHL